VFRWFEFLEFYLAERVPELNPVIRAFGASEFGDIYGIDNYFFEEDRFTDLNYVDALSTYESEKPIHVLFEMGAGSEQAGTPIPRFETYYDTWPPENTEMIEWYLGAEGSLNSTVAATGVDSWQFDPDASDKTFFGPAGYQLLVPLWDIDWTNFTQGNIAAYQTEPFTQAMVIAGPGIVELWVRSPVESVMVQVTLSEVRADGMETLIQSGWLNFSHRAATVDGLDIERTYSQEDFAVLPIDEWTSAQIVIPSVAHPMREGSSLRISITSPGRNHGTWEFETPEYDGNPIFDLGYGEAYPSSLKMSVLSGIEIPAEPPPCPSLRGQPCRTLMAMDNVSGE
jgi:uncharacterized protein